MYSVTQTDTLWHILNDDGDMVCWVAKSDKTIAFVFYSFDLNELQELVKFIEGL